MTAVHPPPLSNPPALPAWAANVSLEPESHAGGWEIHYRLAHTQQMFSGFAEIHCNGQPHCALPIFEPQANALASIDLLREQCLAWIEARNTDPAGRPALAA